MGKSVDEFIFRWPRVLGEMDEARRTGNLSYFDRSCYYRILYRLRECMEVQHSRINPDLLAQRDSLTEICRVLDRAYFAIHDKCQSIDDLLGTRDICIEIGEELDMLDAWLDLIDTYCVGDISWESLTRFIRTYHGEGVC